MIANFSERKTGNVLADMKFAIYQGIECMFLVYMYIPGMVKIRNWSTFFTTKGHCVSNLAREVIPAHIIPVLVTYLL